LGNLRWIWQTGCQLICLVKANATHIMAVQPRRLKALRRLIWIGALSLSFPACDSGQKPAARGVKGERPALPPKTVQTARVTERRIERSVIALGTLAAYEHATLSAKVPGRLETIQVDIGSRVRRGDKLAQIEARDYELKVQQATAALAQARAALGLPLEGDNDRVDTEQLSAVKEARAVLDEAKANHDRIIKLSREKVISESQLDTAQSAYLVALNRYQDALETARQKQALVAQRRAEHEIARQQLTDTTLLAPFDGGVQERRADVGEYLTVGLPILTLVRLDPLRLRGEVSERDAPKVRWGQKMRFTIEGETNVFAGTIQRLSPALDENRMLVVEADIPYDERLRPGYFTRAEIITLPEALALTIPTNAVAVFSGLEKAFTIKADKAAEKRIVTRQRGLDWVEVVSGLAAGEEVILNPGGLQNGSPVTVGPASKPAISHAKGPQRPVPE
jgi:RND family efflux transporter MFP subunit